MTASRLVPGLTSIALVSIAVVLLANDAGAETCPEHALAFGYLTEHADAVVVATPFTDRTEGEGGLRVITLEIEETIRGPIIEAERITLLHRDTCACLTVALRERHLVFLEALPVERGQPRRWVLLSGHFGMRRLPASGPVARFPGLCRDIAAVLDDPVAYRKLLVRCLEEEEPGMAWSGATDLVRHTEMHAALTADERRRIVAAFERQPIGKDTKKALALAAAASRHPSAIPALVKSLLLPRAREIRLEVGEALRRLGGDDSVALVVEALEPARGERAANLLNALGTMAPASMSAAEAARARLRDPAPAVRIEAAHAFGLIARELPDGSVRGRDDLLAALENTEAPNEQRAAVWALAQLDEEEAYAALRKLAATHEIDLVRNAARRYLANPRLSLIFH